VSNGFTGHRVHVLGKKGCVFTEGACEPIVENCEGCERVVDGSIGKVCSAYPAPRGNGPWDLQLRDPCEGGDQDEDAKINPSGFQEGCCKKK